MPKKLTPRGQAAPPQQVQPAPSGAPKRVAKSPAQRTKKAKPAYARNLRGVQARVSLEGGKGRALHFEPRGQRGDLVHVSAEEQQDATFLLNIGLIFEVVDESIGQDIIASQYTNASDIQSGPRLLDGLTNSQGKPIVQDEVIIDQSAEEAGITVANIEQTGDGRYSEQNTEIIRAKVQPPQRADLPGTQDNPLD